VHLVPRAGWSNGDGCKHEGWRNINLQACRGRLERRSDAGTGRFKAIIRPTLGAEWKGNSTVICRGLQCEGKVKLQAAASCTRYAALSLQALGRDPHGESRGLGSVEGPRAPAVIGSAAMLKLGLKQLPWRALASLVQWWCSGQAGPIFRNLPRASTRLDRGKRRWSKFALSQRPNAAISGG
jgi:hypothetical protein